MENNETKNNNATSPEGYFVAIRFQGSDKSYYFSTVYPDLKKDELVVVETISGYEIAYVCAAPKPLSLYHSSLELKPILRRPNKGDLTNHEYNLAKAKKALETCEKDIGILGLPMNLTDAVYTLDGEKVTITYTTPEKRVDFRELLHMLAPQLGCRIELRQISSRDKAKKIGGIGICGLPLCCSTFLNSFEGISIQRAKNQMLTINVPKLTGPCDKYLCCLLYEDDAYTEAKKEFPHRGEVIHTPEGEYSVDAYNILSKTVRLCNATRDDYKTYSLEDIRAMQNGTYKKKEESISKELDLPDYGLVKKEEANEEEASHKPSNKNFNRHNDSRNSRNRNSNENQSQNNNGQFHQRSSQNNRNFKGNRNRNHNHGHNHQNNGNGGNKQ